MDLMVWCVIHRQRAMLAFYGTKFGAVCCISLAQMPATNPAVEKEGKET